MSGPLVIETPRLRLCAWDESDGEAFARHCNTPAVMRWLGGALSDEKLAAAIERYARWQDERGFTFWVVRRKGDASGAGWLGFCGLKLSDAPGSPVTGEIEVGWRLREEAWGQGYAREAAATCLRYAFDALAARRVIAITVSGNRPSWTLMERLGMRRSPELDHFDPRFGPELSDVIVYAATSEVSAEQHEAEANA